MNESLQEQPLSLQPGATSYDNTNLRDRLDPSPPNAGLPISPFLSVRWNQTEAP